MKAPQRIVLDEAVIGVVFLAVGWYTYYLTAVWGMLDYVGNGAFRSYVTGPGIHVEILISALGLGVLFAVVNRIAEVPVLRRRSVGHIILVKGGLYAASVAMVVLVIHAVFVLFFFTWEELQALWVAMSLGFLPPWVPSFFSVSWDWHFSWRFAGRWDPGISLPSSPGDIIAPERRIGSSFSWI